MVNQIHILLIRKEGKKMKNYTNLQALKLFRLGFTNSEIKALFAGRSVDKNTDFTQIFYYITEDGLLVENHCGYGKTDFMSDRSEIIDLNFDCGV